MGMNLDAVIYLQRKGFLSSAKNRVLDIGPQTIYFAKAEQVTEIVANQGAPAAEAAEVERIVYFSTPRPGERTTMLSEITDLTNIEYVSIDVCPGLKNTHILDLNFDKLPTRLHGSFDVVFNFGTTEHIFNQWNCFEVIHDALKVDGVAYHQLPASGYLDHGYYCYTPLFFRELAKANGYEIEQLAVTAAGESRIDALAVQARVGDTLLKAEGHLGENNRIPSLNIHVLLRKTRNAPFRVSLEIATAHSAADRGILARYGETPPMTRFRRLFKFKDAAHRI
jgi:SAM-dependent methyltransferase